MYESSAQGKIMQDSLIDSKAVIKMDLFSTATCKKFHDVVKPSVKFFCCNISHPRWLTLRTTCVWCAVVQGSRDQLEEVWEESDNLNKDDFDPKTFFYLHGTLFTVFYIVLIRMIEDHAEH